MPLTARPAVVGEVLAHWSREQRTLRQGFAALGVSSAVGMVAGVVLGAMEGVLARLPGLLVLVPAAIGMRGAIFGALGARLGTGILTGQFNPDVRAGTFTGDNVRAAALLTLASSAIAGVAARLTTAALGLPSIDLLQLLLVSVLGGALSSVFILIGVLALSRTAAERDWDMDAVGSPIITATGDLVTLPALVVATLFIGTRWVEIPLGLLCGGLAAGATAYGLSGRARPLTHRVVRESLPVLTYAAVVDILAGTVLQTRLDHFVTSPALLVLIPPFIASAGSLGGILSARLGSHLHLGLLTPRLVPERLVSLDGSMTLLFALGLFPAVGAIAHTASLLAGFNSPGLGRLVAVALFGGLLASTLMILVAYAASAVTYRLGLDPDNHGIPIVTATMDFLGVLCLVAAIALFGVN